MRAILLAAILAAATGCAVGNRYDYQHAVTGLPLTGSGTVNVQVIDERDYVVSGDKPAEFVGLQRGGFGNPFDVRTASGRPLADELTDAIESAISQRGYALAATGAADRTLELRIHEWKTDVMMRMRVLYDLALRVLDANGTELARNTTSGEEVLGGGMQNQNAANAARSFEARLTELLRDQDVQAALGAR